MAISQEKYDQFKIDRLKHYLTVNAEKGNARFYEIFVDTLKAVPKTNDAADFESFEDYVNEDTKKIKILIYNTPNSPRNDQYIFDLKEEKKETGLNGIEIESKIQEKIEAERKNWQTNQIIKENEDLKEKLKEAEEYIESLEEGFDQIKNKKFKLGDIDLGELASVMVEGFVRRNPQMLTKLPGGEALAGVFVQDNKEKEAAKTIPPTETEVSFKGKETEANTALSKEDQEYLALLKSLKGSFDEKEIISVMLILQKLSEDRTLIQPVMELLSDKPN